MPTKEVIAANSFSAYDMPIAFRIVQFVEFRYLLGIAIQWVFQQFCCTSVHGYLTHSCAISKYIWVCPKVHTMNTCLKVFLDMCTVNPVQNGHSQKDQINGFQDQLSLNAGQKYCRMLHSDDGPLIVVFGSSLP